MAENDSPGNDGEPSKEEYHSEGSSWETETDDDSTLEYEFDYESGKCFYFN